MNRINWRPHVFQQECASRSARLSNPVGAHSLQTGAQTSQTDTISTTIAKVSVEAACHPVLCTKQTEHCTKHARPDNLFSK